MPDAPPNPGLSSDELHDVTSATLAQNEFEAIALIDLLEEAGIPAAKRSGLVHFGGLGPVEVVVPRVLLKRAKSAIASFRGAASERGVQEAFEPENVEEQRDDADRDPIAAGMLQLAGATPSERAAVLPDYIAEWLAEGMTRPAMARYLAAAGLSREEAEALIATVKSERMDLLVRALDKKFYSGISLCALGVGLLFVPIPFQLPIVVSVFVAGACLAMYAKRRLNALDSGDAAKTKSDN